MKKIYLSVLVLCLIVPVFAQNIIDEEYADLKADENNTVVFVSGRLFQLAGHFIPEDEEIEEIGNIKELVQKVDAFNLVVAKNLPNPADEYQKGNQKLQDILDELVAVRNRDDQFSLYVDEEDGIVYELVGLGMNDKNFVVFSLNGQIDLDQVGNIISKINNAYAKTNETIMPRSEIALDEMKIYPNPSNIDNVINLEVPEEMMGGDINIYDVNGARIRTVKIHKTTHQISTKNFTPGNYFVEIQKEQLSMKKKVLVVQ